MKNKKNVLQILEFSLEIYQFYRYICDKDKKRFIIFV